MFRASLVARGRLAAAAAIGIGAGASALQQYSSAAARPLPQQQASSDKQRLFCWGRLVPSGGDVQTIHREPLDGGFWSSQGLRVVQLEYSDTFAAAIDDRGGLWAWSAQAGPTPRRLACRAALRSLACSKSSLYAVTGRGEVLEWRDLASALCAPDATLPAQPKPLGGALSRVRAASVAAGDAHVLVVGAGGELVGLGDNARGQLGVGEPAERPRCDESTLLPPLRAGAAVAACGGGHSVVALTDGSCVSFGDDRNLQLGVRTTTVKDMRYGPSERHTPTPVRLLEGKRVVGVAAGGGGVEGGHTAFHVRGDDGDELWVCGHGRYGQLGVRSYVHISPPKRVNALAQLSEYDEAARKVRRVGIEKVSCGDRHTAVLLGTGNVFIWGWNDHGQQGDGGTGSTCIPAMLKSPADLRFSFLRGLSCGANSVAAWS